MSVILGRKRLVTTALYELALHIASVETTHPDSAVIVLGDFNHCNLSDELPNYIQQVTCPTRGNNILDHCYTTITSACHAFPSAPLGNVMLFLVPEYRHNLELWSQSPTPWRYGPQMTSLSLKAVLSALIGTSSNTRVSAWKSTQRQWHHTFGCAWMNALQRNAWSHMAIVSPSSAKRLLHSIGKNILHFKEVTRRSTRLPSMNYVLQSEKQSLIMLRNWRITSLTTTLGQCGEVSKRWPTSRKVLPLHQTRTLIFLTNLMSFMPGLRTISPWQSSHLPPLPPLLPLSPRTQEAEVCKLFKKRNVRKAAGPDQLSPAVFRHCADQLASQTCSTPLFISVQSHSVLNHLSLFRSRRQQKQQSSMTSGQWPSLQWLWRCLNA